MRSCVLNTDERLRRALQSSGPFHNVVKMNSISALFVVSVGSLALISCRSKPAPEAAIGTETSAAVAGAASEATVGASVEQGEADAYAPAPSGGYPLAKAARKAGFFYSPYTGRRYDLRAVPSGGLVPDQDTKQLFRKH